MNRTCFLRGSPILSGTIQFLSRVRRPECKYRIGRDAWRDICQRNVAFEAKHWRIGENYLVARSHASGTAVENGWHITIRFRHAPPSSLIDIKFFMKESVKIIFITNSD